MVSSVNLAVAELVVGPIDRSASFPSISFGGDQFNNSGTGIYGSYGSVKMAISGSDVVALSSSGLSVTGSLTASTGLSITTGGLTVTAGGIVITAGGLAVAAGAVSFPNNIVLLNGAGAPVDGTTGDNVAGPGSLYVDRTNGVLYINTGLITNPTWVTVGSQT